MDYDEEDDDGVEAPEFLGVQLLYTDPPSVDGVALASAIRAALPEVDTRIDPGEMEMLFVVHRTHVVHYDDETEAPAMTLVVLTPLPAASARLEESLQQTRGWEEAARVVSSCRWYLTVMEMMSSRLPTRTRLELFWAVLLAALREAPPAAVDWVSAGRIVEPGRLKWTLEEGDEPLRFFSTFNVRFFSVEGSARETIMDTFGLGAIGLTDIQMHFRDLDRSEVAFFLRKVACYLFLNGDCIEDGHTIEGLLPNTEWLCRRRDALVEPSRPVIDVDPGAPYAAGVRHRPETGGNGARRRGSG